MIRTFVKFIVNFVSVFFLMGSIGLCFDTGTNLEIACKIAIVVSLFVLFQYYLWRSEVSVEKTRISLRLLIILIIVIIAIFLIIGMLNVT